MRIANATILFLFLTVLLAGCDPAIRDKDQIHLPEGDAASGKELFVALGCVSCHTVLGAELPETEMKGPIRVVLGSSTSRALTYAQIVTSIVNPSHRLSKRYPEERVSDEGTSLMVNYNDIITVAQVTDLAAFLGEYYEKAERPGYKYPVYSYGGD